MRPMFAVSLILLASCRADTTAPASRSTTDVGASQSQATVSDNRRKPAPDDGEWRQETSAPTGGDFGGVWLNRSGKVFASGPNDTQMTEFDGTKWVVQPSGTTNGIKGMFGFSDTQVYAVGGNFAGSASVLRFDGTQWTSMPGVPQDQYITEIWGTSHDNLYASRVDGSVIHYNGATWAAMATPPGTNRLEGIGGTGKGDIYAVGEGGTIIRFNGTTWTTVASGTTTTLNEVWGSSASDVFVIGQNGTILHFDGRWKPMANPAGTANLLGIWGTSAKDIMVVGTAGLIMHYDGVRWTSMPSGTTTDLQAVHGARRNEYYAVGGGGASHQGSIVLRYSHVQRVRDH
ncbi:MAG TPA: hypothetical protein VMH39_05775 [Gemmatimonadaceae bacterium]|nr:hypothetical protein [Gemmatimonadaceae bacterium]